MSKKTDILRKCVSCHDENMCQNEGNREGSCSSGVSVLQKVTLNSIGFSFSNKLEKPIIKILSEVVKRKTVDSCCVIIISKCYDFHVLFCCEYHQK